MITKQQAIEENEFHYACHRFIGKRGGVKQTSDIWRRNGKTQTWKTRANEFRVPIKFGLYGYAQLQQHDAGLFHCQVDCPLNDKSWEG